MGISFGLSGAATGKGPAGSRSSKSRNIGVFSLNSGIMKKQPKKQKARRPAKQALPEIDMILVRHGQSLWNQKNLFTGWIDVDLSERGRGEALRAGAFLKRILRSGNLKLQWAFSSALKRAVHTLDLILKEARLTDVPVTKAWQLNERHYGALQGQNKAKIKKKHGEELFLKWRRGFDSPPPLLPEPEIPKNPELYQGLRRFPRGESLRDTQARVLPFWRQSILPKIQSGRGPVLIAAHGNSLRALIKHLQNIPDENIPLLSIQTGEPLLYSLNREKRVWRQISCGGFNL